MDAKASRRRPSAPRHPRPSPGDGACRRPRGGPCARRRVESGAPLEPPPVHPRSASLTVGDLVDRYERYRVQKGGHGSKSLADAIAHVRRGLKDYLTMPARRRFGKHELRAARARYSPRPPRCHRIGSWPTSADLRVGGKEDLIEVDFSKAVIRSARKQSAQRPSRDEIRRVWHACDRARPDTGLASLWSIDPVPPDHRPAPRRGGRIRFGDILDGVWRMGADNKIRSAAHRTPPPLALSIAGAASA